MILTPRASRCGVGASGLATSVGDRGDDAGAHVRVRTSVEEGLRRVLRSAIPDARPRMQADNSAMDGASFSWATHCRRRVRSLYSRGRRRRYAYQIRLPSGAKRVSAPRILLSQQVRRVRRGGGLAVSRCSNSLGIVVGPQSGAESNAPRCWHHRPLWPLLESVSSC